MTPTLHLAKGMLMAALCMPLLPAHADAVAVSTPQVLIPPNIITTANRPMMMLVTSKDHTLFSPVYTDFEDLNGDGTLETTYAPTFKYYGYFDSSRCYSYSNAVFTPVASAATSYTYSDGTATVAVSGYSCSAQTGRWSGNFLNWATMTRLDTIRKLLYGGKRSTDTATTTVLERAPLSRDSHGFVKLYRGLDIAHFTPFTPDTNASTGLIKTTGSNAGVYAGLSICNRSSDKGEGGTPLMILAKGNYKLWATVEGSACEWRDSTSENIDTGAKQLGSKLAAYYFDTDKGDGKIRHEVNRPNKSLDGALGSNSELTVRVAACVANQLDTKSCRSYASSDKPIGLLQDFGLPEANSVVARTEFGLISGSYDNNLTAGALRRNIGDLRDEINTTTGVFCHAANSGCGVNGAGGALADGRATGAGAIKAMDNIILYGANSGDYTGDSTKFPSGLANGQFPAWGNPIGEMVVQALQYYAGASSTNPSPYANDTSKNLPVATWRNPLGESDNTINTARKAAYGRNICRPLNVLALSSSALSFDQDADTAFESMPNRGGRTLNAFTNKIGIMEGINNTSRSVASISGTLAEAETNAAGCSAKTVGELSSVFGICPEAPTTAGTYKVAGAAFYANTHRIVDTSSMTLPADMPAEALKVKTYAASLAGGAPIIEVPIPVKGSSTSSPTVFTKKFVYITPEALGVMNTNSTTLTQRMPMSVLTFDAINASKPDPTNTDPSKRYPLPWGSFMVTWNNRTFGGDYDMDIAGFLRYDVISNPNTDSGYDVRISTDIVNVGMGSMGAYGFSVIGSATDGRRLTHRHTGNNTSDAALLASGARPLAAGYLCGDTTNESDGTTYLSKNNAGSGGACKVASDGDNVYTASFLKSNLYQMVGTDGVILKDPLWYTAKYGSFDSQNYTYTDTGADANKVLPVGTYDALKTDGSGGEDGTPDGYFLARRPDLLEEQLRRALDSLAKNSNAAPATTSGSLSDSSFKYVAKFDSTLVTGNIEAYQLLDTGEFSSTAAVQAGQVLQKITTGTSSNPGDKGDSRAIITNWGNKSTATPTAAFPFRWATLASPTLPSNYIAQITSASTNTLSNTNAQRLVQYMRGDQTLENVVATKGLRYRGDNMLGPVVNSTPWVQSAPAANYLETQFPGYAAFVEARKARTNLLWVGANDGMLHAFDIHQANSTSRPSLAEKFAYIPGMVANRLAEIPLQRGTAGYTQVEGVNFVTTKANGTVETKPDGTAWAYVDGNPFTADVKTNITIDSSTRIETGGTWNTYLFSALGRGGRGFFALDVTDIGQLSEGNANSVFKWQFSSDDDNDVGYMVGDIGSNTNTGQANPIVKLNNGKFAVLLNNGPKSTNGNAALFLVFVDGPDSSTGNWTQITSSQPNGHYVKIVADAGPSNGLSKPLWIDRDGNGTADVVYAGDLKGNMWKFDLGSATPSEWKVAYKTANGVNRPLFKAQYTATVNNVATTTALPITAAPEYVYPAFDGLIINFGTGNAFEAGDFPKEGVNQRFYGIWDRPAFATAAATGTGPMIPAAMTSLVQRNYARNTSTGNVTVTADSTVNGVDIYTSINWTTQDGWYFNLPAASEALLSDPDLQAGYLIFASVWPKTGTDNCSNTRNATLYIIDPIAGRTTRLAQGLVNGVAIAGTSVSDQKWVTVNNRTTTTWKNESCTPGTAGCVNGKLRAKADPNQSCKTVVGSDGSRTLCYNPLGRVQWREIPGLRTQ